MPNRFCHECPNARLLSWFRKRSAHAIGGLLHTQGQCELIPSKGCQGVIAHRCGPAEWFNRRGRVVEDRLHILAFARQADGAVSAAFYREAKVARGSPLCSCMSFARLRISRTTQQRKRDKRSDTHEADQAWAHLHETSMRRLLSFTINPKPLTLNKQQGRKKNKQNPEP